MIELCFRSRRRAMTMRSASNGGEGGIGVALQPLFETACGVPSPLCSVEPDGSHLILLIAILRLCLKWRRRRD
jgi:hypothetical protein